MKKISPLLQKIIKTVSTHKMLEKRDSVVAGVSGGPDSVALLLALMDISRIKKLNLALHLVHLNHRIRGREADRDEKFVRVLAGKYGLPISVYRRDVKEIAKKKKKSIELVAREERYKIYERVAQKIKAKKIALGHTADDNAETFFFNLMRGAGFAGLGGIPAMRKLENRGNVFIIRPLMELSRKEVLQFLKDRAEGFRIDSSNLRTEYYRNKIRHKLIPLIEKEFNPRIKENIARLSPFFSELDRRYRLRAEKLWKRVLTKVKADEIRFSGAKRFSGDEILLGYFVRKVFDYFGEDAHLLTFDCVRKIQGFLKISGVHKPARLAASNIRMEKTKTEIVFRKAAPKVQKLRKKALPIPGEVIFGEQGYRIRAQLVKRPKRLKGKNPYREIIDFDKAGGRGARFYVRSRRRGDVFSPLGMIGTKKLQDFFVDEKVPESQRDTLPLVLANEEIIWVVGKRISERVRINENTRSFLMLTFTCSNRDL